MPSTNQALRISLKIMSFLSWREEIRQLGTNKAFLYRDVGISSEVEQYSVYESDTFI